LDRKNQDWIRWIPEDDAGRIPSPGPMELVQQLLSRLPGRSAKTVAHLGAAPLSRLRMLASGFERLVVVVDRERRATDFPPRDTEAGIEWHARVLTDLTPLHGRVDVALADGTLCRCDPAELDAVLEQVLCCLTEGGLLAATFPAAPSTGAAREMRLRLDRAPRVSTLALHEVELQYRLRRSGFGGVRILRLESPHGACLLCLAVRRANN